MAAQHPEVFRPFLTDFFVNAAGDAAAVRQQKLDVLVCICADDNVDAVLRELLVLPLAPRLEPVLLVRVPVAAL